MLTGSQPAASEKGASTAVQGAGCRGQASCGHQPAAAPSTRLAERQQRLVDGCALSQALALRPRHLLPLAARQVHKAQQAAPHAHRHRAAPAGPDGAGAGCLGPHSHPQLHAALRRGRRAGGVGNASQSAVGTSGGAFQPWNGHRAQVPWRSHACAHSRTAVPGWSKRQAAVITAAARRGLQPALACSTMWERLLAAFMRVAAVCRLPAARSSRRSTSPTAGRHRRTGGRGAALGGTSRLPAPLAGQWVLPFGSGSCMQRRVSPPSPLLMVCQVSPLTPPSPSSAREWPPGCTRSVICEVITHRGTGAV